MCNIVFKKLSVQTSFIKPLTASHSHREAHGFETQQFQRTEEKQPFFPDKKTATQFSLELFTIFLGTEKLRKFSSRSALHNSKIRG